MKISKVESLPVTLSLNVPSLALLQPSILPHLSYHLQTFCSDLNHTPLILTIRFNVRCSCSCVSQPTSCSPAGHINPCDRCLSVCSPLGSSPKWKHKVLDSTTLPEVQKKMCQFVKNMSVSQTRQVEVTESSYEYVTLPRQVVFTALLPMAATLS